MSCLGSFAGDDTILMSLPALPVIVLAECVSATSADAHVDTITLRHLTHPRGKPSENPRHSARTALLHGGLQHRPAEQLGEHGPPLRATSATRPGLRPPVSSTAMSLTQAPPLSRPPGRRVAAPSLYRLFLFFSCLESGLLRAKGSSLLQPPAGHIQTRS